MIKYFRSALDTLSDEGRLRRLYSLERGKYIDLSNNDYLGLAHSTENFRKEFLESVQASFTASSSRLLSTDSLEAEKVEKWLACNYSTTQSERDALLFNSGYHLNTGCIPALSQGNTIILADRLSHASIIDGIKLSGKRFIRWKHNDIQHLRQLLDKEAAQYGRVLVIAESLYSMDGDLAPLKELVEMKHIYGNILLYIDEAHAIGTRGDKGLGVAEEMGLIADIDFIAGTFGKAIASAGAFIVTHPIVKQYLVNTARSLIFSTALPPVCHLWTLEMLKLSAASNHLRLRLADISCKIRETIEYVSGQPNPSASQIIPWIIGDSGRCVAISGRLRDEGGIIAFPIRKPTVAAGTERIRFSLNAAMTDEAVEHLCKCLTTTV